MKIIKNICAKIHLILGLVSGAVVFVVALTGSLYVFEEEARNLLQRRYFYVQPIGQKQPLDACSEIVRQTFPANSAKHLAPAAGDKP